MENINTQNFTTMYTSKNTPKTPKPSNKRLTQEHVQLLEASFGFNSKLDPDRKYHLAQQLDLPTRQVAVWYQNKRARWKSQCLEIDHKALNQRLEKALGENEKLQKEVQRLRQELESAQQQLLFMSTSSSSSTTIACNKNSSNYRYNPREKGGLSLLDEEPNSSLASDLFACLIGNHEEQL